MVVREFARSRRSRIRGEAGQADVVGDGGTEEAEGVATAAGIFGCRTRVRRCGAVFGVGARCDVSDAEKEEI